MLNNLADKKEPEGEGVCGSEASPMSYGRSNGENKGNLYTGSYGSGTVYQPRSTYEYKPITVSGGT